jgi:pimeloyl-ACP methyl ester carboxylesterase
VEYELNLEEYSTHENVRGKRLRIICMEHPHDVMPAIFFFHGAGGQAEQWKEQLKYFHNRGTLVAVDMVGHGRSEVSSNLADYHPDSLVLDLVDVFLRYKRQHNVIIAHSYGTSLAARAYAHVKDSVTACGMLMRRARGSDAASPACHAMPPFIAHHILCICSVCGAEPAGRGCAAAPAVVATVRAGLGA